MLHAYQGGWLKTPLRNACAQVDDGVRDDSVSAERHWAVLASFYYLDAQETETFLPESHFSPEEAIEAYASRADIVPRNSLPSNVTVGHGKKSRPRSGGTYPSDEKSPDVGSEAPALSAVLVPKKAKLPPHGTLTSPRDPLDANSFLQVDLT